MSPPLQPILAFDIETVPDPELGERLFHLSGSAKEIAEGMLKARSEETSGKTSMLKPPYHRVVMISLAWLNLSERQFKLDSLGDGTTGEPAMIERFLRVLSHPKPFLLVSWNGKGFDLPVLLYRAMLHWIPFSSGGARDFLHRYGDAHLDLMDVLARYGQVDRLRLDEWAQILGLPGKTLTRGEKIYEHVERGEWELIRTYCELDALSALLFYLRFAFVQGGLSGEECREALALIIADLDRRSEPYQITARALERWTNQIPAGSSPS